MVKKIFPIFDKFRMYVRHLQLEVSGRYQPGEGHHDVKGVSHRVGPGAPARPSTARSTVNFHRRFMKNRRRW